MVKSERLSLVRLSASNLGLFFRFDSVLFVSLQEFLDSGILLAPGARGGLIR
jgi:hypothetical protein